VATHLHLTVDNTSIRLFAQEPTPAPGTRHPAIILLHGAGGNLDYWASRLAPFLLQANVALYAPHYFDRTGTTYADLATIQDPTNTAQWLAVVDEAVRFAAGRPGIDQNRIVLAGISLGGFLSLAFAANLSASPDAAQRTRLRALVDISGGLVEPYLSRATAHFPPTLILHGVTDNIVPVTFAENLDRRLTELDVAHRTELLPNEGHWFSQSSFPRILLAVSSFLQDHLQETRTTHPAM
jgi:carboxymethylenebutenolidase